jgi:hypothetical protein
VLEQKYKKACRDFLPLSTKKMFQAKRCFKQKDVSSKKMFQAKRCFKQKDVPRHLLESKVLTGKAHRTTLI